MVSTHIRIAIAMLPIELPSSMPNTGMKTVGVQKGVDCKENATPVHETSTVLINSMTYIVGNYNKTIHQLMLIRHQLITGQ